jgi:cell division protein FtsA
MPAKEISVKNLANIIQARMSEILDFVTYHLKQVGLDNKALNGGVVLTGGGSQLKHLIQLTEYVTGLNARIGLPNEHLAAGHLDDLSKPTYSTCIGLILKGLDDFENNRQDFSSNYLKMESEALAPLEDEATPVAAPEEITEVDVTYRKGMAGFWDKFRDRIIELFREEEDSKFTGRQ